MKRKKLIAIYGGTKLTPQESNFVSQLSFSLINDLDAKLVTGGFKYKEKEDPESFSTDEAVLNGAMRFVQMKNLRLEEYLETWLPEIDQRKEKLNIDRFEEGTVKELPGNDKVRRLSVVRDVDGILTFGGSGQTEWVLAAAQAAKKLALPLPFSGNDSQRYWEENKGDILNLFENSRRSLRDLSTVELLKLAPSEYKKIIEDIVKILHEGFLSREIIALDKIDQIIKTGDLKEAILRLEYFCDHHLDNERQDIARHLSARFYLLQGKKINGLLNNYEESIETNNLINSIQKIIKELRDQL